MNSDWIDTFWGEIATLEYGKGLRDYKTNNKKYSVYGTNGPIGTHDEFICDSPGVIIGRKGAYRGVHFSPKPFYVIDTAFWLKHNKKVDTKWAYYQILSKNINSLDSGSAIPSTSREDFYSIPVSLPTFKEQKAIADILSKLDEKIEINKKTNETLEGIVEALFKSWFIDFEPVRAKSKNLSTGLSDEISDLFPDSFESSVYGEIPKEWSIFKLSDFISLDSGLPYKGKLKGEGDGYLMTMGCADKFVRFKSQGVYRYPSDMPKKHLIRPGDIVICSHDLTQARDQLGQPFVVPTIYEGETTAAATNTFIVRSKKDFYSEFLYQFFRTKSFRDQMIASAKGSVILHVSKDAILDHNLATPSSEKILHAYHQITNSLISKVNENLKNSQILISTRDNLLPKLISGELRIPDSEKIIGDLEI